MFRKYGYHLKTQKKQQILRLVLYIWLPQIMLFSSSIISAVCTVNTSRIFFLLCGHLWTSCLRIQILAINCHQKNQQGTILKFLFCRKLHYLLLNIFFYYLRQNLQLQALKWSLWNTSQLFKNFIFTFWKPHLHVVKAVLCRKWHQVSVTVPSQRFQEECYLQPMFCSSTARVVFGNVTAEKTNPQFFIKVLV